MPDLGEPLTVDVFCRAIVQKLIASDRMRLPFDSAEMAAAMSSVAREVLLGAREAYAAGETELGDQLLAILDDISPSPTTGAFDGFWSAFRALQPARAGVENPLYPELRFKKSAASDVQAAPEGNLWRKLIDKSASRILEHL